MRVEQADEVAAAVADGTEEWRVARDGRHQVDIGTIGQERVADADAAKLRDDVKGGVASEGAVDDAAGAAGMRWEAGSRRRCSKHTNKIIALQGGVTASRSVGMRLVNLQLARDNQRRLFSRVERDVDTCLEQRAHLRNVRDLRGRCGVDE
jgi:hypothetical protein